MQWPMPKENQVLKLELSLDEQTTSELDGQSRICNWLYNHLLEKGQQLKQQFIQIHDLTAANHIRIGSLLRYFYRAKRTPDSKTDF